MLKRLLHSEAVPDSVLASHPPAVPPTGEAGWQAYVLDYLKGLGVPEAEASPLLPQISALVGCPAAVSLTAIEAAALETYVWASRDFVVAFLRQAGDPQDAEDLTHDFLATKMIPAIRRGLRPRSNLKGWMRKAAINLLRDRYKARLCRQPEHPADGQRRPEISLDAPRRCENSKAHHASEPADPRPGPAEEAEFADFLNWLRNVAGEPVAEACFLISRGCKIGQAAGMAGVSTKTMQRWRSRLRVILAPLDSV